MRNELTEFAKRHQVRVEEFVADALPTGEEPQLVVVSGACEEPVRVGRRVSRLWPRCMILLLLDSKNVPAYSMLGANARVASADSFGARLEQTWLELRRSRRHRMQLANLNQKLAAPGSSERRNLETSDRYLATLLACAHDAILSLDPRGSIVTWNPAAARLFGYSEAEVVGNNVRLLQVQGQVWEPTASTQSSVTGTRHELTLKRKDGGHFAAEVTSAPITDPGGAFLGTAVVVRDATARYETEALLRQMRHAAEAASHAKTTFLAHMSHEIRTPLGAILGFADLLGNPDVDPQDRQFFLETIQRNGRTLIRLIDDVLDLSKVEAGKLEIVIDKVPLGLLLADVRGLLGSKAAEQGNELHIVVATPVPETILTDVTRLKQIITNIAGNSLKFTTCGRVTITLSLQGRQLELLVEDTGRGIERANWDKLFQPFSQEDATTTREFGGTGLGLALARTLARKLGGDVELVDSTVGIGSKFLISIDCGSLAGVPLVSEFPESATPTPEPWLPDPSLLRGLKILVAEDLAENRFLVQRALVAAGAEVDVCENGAQALSQARDGRYDALVLDIQMPLVDGRSVARQLRSEGHTGPIIALTAHAILAERQASLDAGCTAHLTKPVNFAELVRTLREVTSW
jgi:PAS domain S-box-containing protein